MSWYKISKNSEQLDQIAYEVREYILTKIDEDSLASMCLPVSRHLAYVLISKGYAAANVVKGMFTIDDPDPSAYEDWSVEDFGDEDSMESAQRTPLHYWVQIGNMVIDITGDQFNDELDDPWPEIFIGDFNAAGVYTVIQEDVIEPKLMF